MDERYPGCSKFNEPVWYRSIPLRMLYAILWTAFTVIGPGEAIGQRTDSFKAADTSSPRDTLKSFIDACNEVSDLIADSNHFDRHGPEFLAISQRVIDCIDDSKLPGFAKTERAGQVAICLKEILDRVAIPDWDDIPDAAAIEAKGGYEKLTFYRIPDTRITIARVEGGPRRHEYLFSTGTVDRAEDYFKSIESKPYRSEGPRVSKNFYRWYMSKPGHPIIGAIVSQLPERMQTGRTWGVANWKIPGLLLNAVVGIFLIVIAYRMQLRLTNPAREKGQLMYWLTLAFPIFAMLVPLIFKYCNYRYLTLRGDALYVSDFIGILVAILTATILVFATFNRIAASVIASPHINPSGLNAQLIRIVSKLLSLVVAVILFLVGGQFLGIPVATLLASAGIGGVAVALGAQDTLKTLFGTLMLLSDKPFRVGERIVFETYDGIVEDIGLRSTKIRMLNGHQVTLPNDRLAGNDIENIGRRRFIRRVGEIYIPLDSTREKIDSAVTIIRDELEDHEGLDPSYPPRVFFDDFCSDGFKIKFFCWYSPPDFWKFKKFNENLNFAIFQRFEEQGIQFSLPQRHSFWKHDHSQGPLDVALVDKTKIQQDDLSN